MATVVTGGRICTVRVAEIALFSALTAVTVMVTGAVNPLPAFKRPCRSMVAMSFPQSTDQITFWFVAVAGVMTAFSVMVLPCATALAPRISSVPTALPTVRVIFAERPEPSVALAVIVTLPTFFAVTRPFASTVAMRLLLVDQATCWEASSGMHFAVS